MEAAQVENITTPEQDNLLVVYFDADINEKGNVD